MTLEEDRLILHDLKGVNLKVDFILGARQEYLQHKKCIAYSVCYESVDVKVFQLTLSDQICDLDFYFSTQQLVIDDHTISGDVLNFHCSLNEAGVLVAACAILLGKDY